MKNRTLFFLSVVLVAWATVIPPANAYVDPGTGSFIFQVIIGGVLAVAVSVKVFWRRIVGLFVRRPAEPDE